MNIEKQLETAIKTNHLVLVVFYADWSPHYEWIGPVLRTYEKRTVELIRVNAEENRASLQEVAEAPAFEKQEDFIGLSQFEIETVEIRVPDANAAQEFYSKIENALDFLTFTEAEGQDLQADSALTWDLTMLKAQVNRLETAALRPVFEGREVFVPKSDKFLLSQDSSKIELWFEA